MVIESVDDDGMKEPENRIKFGDEWLRFEVWFWKLMINAKAYVWMFERLNLLAFAFDQTSDTELLSHLWVCLYLFLFKHLSPVTFHTYHSSCDIFNQA